MKNKFTAFLFLLLIGCATTGENMRTIDIGMTEDQVQNVLGRPEGKKADGEYISYKYSNRLISGWSWDRADFQVIFKDGKVVEYGAGEVRVKDNVMFLVPLKL